MIELDDDSWKGFLQDIDNVQSKDCTPNSWNRRISLSEYGGQLTVEK